MLINVKTLSGKTITLDVSSQDSIAEIKKEIQAQKGPPAEQQVLLFNGIKLENHQCLNDYNIKEKSTLYCRSKLLRENDGGKQFEISIKILTKVSKTFSLSVCSTDLIIDVKKQIYQREGINTEKQRLIFGKTELSNNTQTLSHYNIKMDSVLFLLSISNANNKCVSTTFAFSQMIDDKRYHFFFFVFLFCYPCTKAVIPLIMIS